ncbi:hypothetical protein [Chromobacterium sphagni]|uniref:Uncharacterized protein n=1 Tax=Chromobacterium sphagni TaxID=1903179 RepID=A0A1S1WTU3_9NEIS|nr:hypothetical protein [Chromobacterium sphagni]OHX10302.1 hypothetical protein BI347_21145 [Chromobacterium sphagni]OHX19713.1 hypothetical protein BI344_08745 [Chromobacterium sphagni]
MVDDVTIESIIFLLQWPDTRALGLEALRCLSLFLTLKQSRQMQLALIDISVEKSYFYRKVGTICGWKYQGHWILN